MKLSLLFYMGFSETVRDVPFWKKVEGRPPPPFPHYYTPVLAPTGILTKHLPSAEANNWFLMRLETVDNCRENVSCTLYCVNGDHTNQRLRVTFELNEITISERLSSGLPT